MVGGRAAGTAIAAAALVVPGTLQRTVEGMFEKGSDEHTVRDRAGVLGTSYENENNTAHHRIQNPLPSRAVTAVAITPTLTASAPFATRFRRHHH